MLEPLAPLLALFLLGAAPARAADPAPLPREAAAEAVSETAPEIDPEARAAAEAEAAATQRVAAAEADLFAMPRIAEQTRAASARIQAGDFDGGARILDRLAAAHPGIGLLEANRATLMALRGDRAGAIRALVEAAARGFDGVAALAADPIFAGIAEDPEIAALVTAEQAARPPVDPAVDPAATLSDSAGSNSGWDNLLNGAAPSAAERPRPRPPLRITAVAEGAALVSGANTVWDPVAERLRVSFAFPASATGAVAPDRKTAATDILREHYRRGRAAGNLGDLYDNRDRGHSVPDPKDAPQVTRVVYGPAARAADLDYGLADQFLFDAPTFGNSSTAITSGALWRSLPRFALTRADGTGPLRLWQNARANALYVYPAHKDYGAEGGDLFPANTPYLLVSHGSSGSDKPFLAAVAMILAAYRPDTKARLVAEGLIVPMTQMVFRRSLQTVRSRDDYFSAAAHPAVFEGYDINLARMVSLANAIKPSDIPPQVRIAVTAEDPGTEGLDWFGAGLSEQLFDTPAAVARIWRSRAFTREITLSAAETADPNGRPLTFAWRLLAGDPSKVRITPAPDGRSATIALDWQEPFPISKDNPIVSHRVDIGVFANNGVHDSAPAILSVYFPPEQARVYETGPDGAERIASIDYLGHPDAYADPALLPRTDWRDDYHYAAEGAPLGWTRIWTNGATETFDAGGRRIPAGPDGAAGTAEAVSYPLRQRPDGALVLGESPSPPGGLPADPVAAPAGPPAPR